MHIYQINYQNIMAIIMFHYIDHNYHM